MLPSTAIRDLWPRIFGDRTSRRDSWVLGYFRDGNDRQEPIVLGTLPSYPSELSQSGGFYDPNAIYPKYKDEPDTNRLAVANEDKEHLSLTLRKATRITGISTADFDPFTNPDGTAFSYSASDTFDQPEIPYAAVYPFNNVYESESGHIREYDDTQAMKEYTKDIEQERHMRLPPMALK